MEPTIVVSSENADVWGRQVSIQWPASGWRTQGDNSVAHGGTATGPDGFGLMGAAFGVCMVTTLIEHAQQLGLSLEHVQAQISTKARLPGRELAPYLSHFHIDLYLEGDLDDAQRATLERLTAERCGVRETLLREAVVSERVLMGRAPDLT
jgi:uncharacterized OsmC-like protein